MNRSFPVLGYMSWSGLGFLRGINAYHYTTRDKDTYLYVHAFGYGCCGFLFYTNPVLLPFSVYKEVYRLEVNVRNLEHEKTVFYYTLF